jgi:hypothetical protein
MATRQGFSGSLTQYGDDTRRALISNAVPTSMLSHRWFSNMNTTCTIKSAPPRTPEVMMLLSTKHGWLFKRNEQGVWQRRYCCVVPHTFLYYFDTEPAGQPNDSAYAMGDGINVDTATPVGIIDLECYSHVNRLSVEDNIMELKGDSITNPDLRSFFFKGENKRHCEEWTTAFLTDRHQALRDEREALREVCDSFPLQLANMNNMIKEAEAKAEEKESETYRIRSLIEEGRKQILNRVREGLETLHKVPPKTNGDDRSNNSTDVHKRLSQQNNIGQYERSASQSFKVKIQHHQATACARLDSLDTHRLMGGAVESVSIILDLLQTIVAEYHSLYLQSHNLSHDLHLKSKLDNEQLQHELSSLQKSSRKREVSLERRVSELDAAVLKVSKENSDLTSMLTNMQLETSIHAKKNKEKLAVLTEHKKILKKEVIDLRATLEEVKSELDVVSHQKIQLEGRYKREKSRRLGIQENYQALREQLAVQERVWGMMQSSLAGGSVVLNPSDNNSVAGGGGGVNSVQFDGGIHQNAKLSSAATRNSNKPVGVTNIGFHPRDVVVKRRVKDGKADDERSKGSKESRGSRGSWHSGKSLADEDDSESSATESQNGSEGERNKLKETRNGAAPPRHPNPSANSIPRHNRTLSRCDASVMSEITTDRDIATHVGDAQVDDATYRSKPAAAIVIDNDVAVQDEEQEEESGLKTPKRSRNRSLQTIPSASSASPGNSPEGGEAVLNNTSNAMTPFENIVSKQSSDDSNDIRILPEDIKQTGVPLNSEETVRVSLFMNPGLCGIDLGGDHHRFQSSSTVNSSPLAGLVACVPGCDDDTENVHGPPKIPSFGASKQQKLAGQTHESSKSPLPPHIPATDNVKDKRDRPPPSSRKVPQSSVLTKSSLDSMLAESDAASVASAASQASRKSSVINGYAIPGHKYEFSSSKKDADTVSVASTCSALTPSKKLSIAE